MDAVEKDVRLLVKKEMQYHAVHMAVEAIQLAAMICKPERSQRR